MDEKNYSHQNLVKANFSGVHVEGANFRYADLRRANFNVAFIKDADFSFANLEGVSLGEIKYVQNLAFNPAGTWLAVEDTSGNQCKVKIWDIADDRELYTIYTGSHRTSEVVFSPDGAFLAADNNSDKKIIIYHISNNWKSFELRGHSDDINCFAFHPNSTVLAAGSDDKTVKIWDLKSCNLINTYTGHKEDVKAVAFSPDGQWLASADDHLYINIWDMETGKQIRNFRCEEKNDYTFGDMTLIFSPDGRLLVVSHEYSDTIHLFEIHADWKHTTLKSKGDVESLCFSPDGNYLQVALRNQIQWWDMQSFSVIRDIKLSDSGSFFAFSYEAKRIAVGTYRNKIDILELESCDKIHTIQQELHCVRTNIFGVTGLREDQRQMMLKRGAVEVGPNELERTGEKIAPYIRRQRLQELVGNLKEGYKRKRIPAVLLLGPGTFLPPLNLLDKDDRYFFDRFELPFSIKKEMSAEEWNDHLDHFYYEILREGKHYFRENRWREKPGKMTSRNLELLRQNYNSLVHLVNEGLFPIVIDMDIFSELNREMFGIEPFKESYRDMEDLDYSIRQLGREMDYLEKGRGFYFKVFSEEGSYNKRYMMRDEKDPERFFERIFEEIFHRILYRYEKELRLVWTGFWPRHSMHDIPFRRMERGQSFYWVVDENLRESLETEHSEATFLDYPVGKFSDFFYDLHRELGFDDRDMMMEVPIGISELKSRVYSDFVEKRLEAARALPARAASPLASRKLLHMQEDLFNRLLHDSNLEVRQTLFREIISRIEQLPPDINTIIEGFSEDKDDSVRADIAAWIIGQYDRFGKEYESILLKLAKDRSQYVRATIINTIKKRFEQLPSHIRQLASQLVGTGLAVEMVRGGGMLMDTPTELVLEITNHGLESISTVDIEILISAEYNIESNNPVILTQLEPESPAQVVFTIRPRANHRIPVNYKVNGELREPPLQVNVIRDNPYIYGNPIDSSDSFFGRQQELVDIVQAVSKPNKQDILLVGERRTGKSSLFYQILKHLNPPFFPVYIVMNEAPDKADSVISFICGKVIRFFIEHLALPTEPWNHFKCTSLGLTDNLKTILDAAHKTRPDLKLVLLLDEADYILKVEDRLQNLMRAAFQSLEVGSVVRAVVAGTTDLSTYVSQRSSPFFNHFRFVYLKPLGESETRDLIAKPAESLGYTYEAAAIERIAKACGGHPYYCQRICYEAFLQSIKAKHPIITNAQAESAVRKVIQEADAYNGFITGFWNATPPRQPLTSSQKKFLKNLANKKTTAKVKKHEIQRLLDWQLVKECNGDCRFTCELFEEWTKQAPLR